MIIANHAHLMPPQADWCGWPAGSMETLLQHLDDCGIDRVVIFPPFACQVENSMQAANRWALGEARKHPDRIIPAGTIFPLAGDIIEMLHILHDEGVRLAKVHPSIDRYDIADPAAGPCYATASELGIALDFHTGPHGTRLSLAAPTKFDDLAWDYPQLKLVFEHLGGRTYFEEFLAILSNHHATPRRVFGGLTSVLAYDTHRMWYLGLEKIAEVIACAGPESLIFGLDFPWNPASTTKRDIEIIKGLDIPEADKSRILGGNLAELLGL
ncbi:MAG: amidohydrolase family protein [Armatimonadota bacterium]